MCSRIAPKKSHGRPTRASALTALLYSAAYLQILCRAALVGKRVRSISLYHSRQCGNILKPCSDFLLFR